MMPGFTILWWGLWYLHAAPVPTAATNKTLRFHTKKPITFSPGKDSLETWTNVSGLTAKLWLESMSVPGFMNIWGWQLKQFSDMQSNGSDSGGRCMWSKEMFITCDKQTEHTHTLSLTVPSLPLIRAPVPFTTTSLNRKREKLYWDSEWREAKLTSTHKSDYRTLPQPLTPCKHKSEEPKATENQNVLLSLNLSH